MAFFHLIVIQSCLFDWCLVARHNNTFCFPLVLCFNVFNRRQKSLFINLAKKSSLAPHAATALFSTDLNLTTRGVEKHFSYFSEQISGIIPLHSLPAEVSCSVSLHHVKRDQVFVPTASNWSPDPPLSLLLECVSQSELSHPWDETNLLFFFFKSPEEAGAQGQDVAHWFVYSRVWQHPKGLLRQRFVYQRRVEADRRGHHLPTPLSSQM